MSTSSLQGLGEASDLSPIWWLHIPKTGSSLAVVLAHYACGTAIPDDLTLIEPHKASLKFPPHRHLTKCGGDGWKRVDCSTTRWNCQCGSGSFLHFEGHEPVGVDFPDDDLSHVATMFRDPEQRAISGWNHRKHSCENSTSIQGYADCVKNCQTQMLSGHGCGRDGPAPSLSDYRRAERRIWKLGFVGLTSQWDLSVCLFHAMYGGICKPVEFFNTRPGVNHSDSPYNATEYGLKKSGEVSYDDRLYAEARKLFWHRIEMYGVTRQSCAALYCRPSKDFFEAALGSTERVRFNDGGTDFNFDWPGRPAYNED